MSIDHLLRIDLDEFGELVTRPTGESPPGVDAIPWDDEFRLE
jgi:hypothetical protein